MRPANLVLVGTVLLALASLRCGAKMESPGPGSPDGGTGSGGTTGMGGRVTTGQGGSVTQGAGGTTSPGGIDDGHLFADAAVVGSGTGGAVGQDSGTNMADAARDVRADGPPGDGHVATASITAVGLTAVFTQRGVDVTVVVTATQCAAGNHTLTVHDGYSCDSAATQMGTWGGTRGSGIATLTCNAARQGTLTYTRIGTNPATNWTVGDHNTLTDITQHPITLDTNCGTFF